MLVGIDIGGTKCAVFWGEVTESAHIAGKVKFPTLSVNKSLEKICEIIDTIEEIDAIGLSSGGPLDERRGIIQSPPNLPGWDDVRIVDMLTERYGVPVRLMNDANACALAEWKYGAGRGTDNMIFLTFGTGLGAGLILDGKLYSGASGMAGEVGHIRLRESGPMGYGKRGSFEGFCSGGGIANAARDLAKEAKAQGRVAFMADTDDKIESLTAATVASLARAGDKDAQGIFNKCAERLGEGLAILTDILNPEVIVIGSIYERCCDLLADGVRAALDREALAECGEVVRVLPAMLGDSIGDVAALAVAKAALADKNQK